MKNIAKGFKTAGHCTERDGNYSLWQMLMQKKFDDLHQEEKDAITKKEKEAKKKKTEAINNAVRAIFKAKETSGAPATATGVIEL